MISSSDLVKTMLINGEANLCKAFLFEIAIVWGREGKNPYYFASKQIETQPIPFHGRKEPSAESLKNITFMYTKSYEQLAATLVNLHTYKKQASVILIDDIDYFSSHPDIKNYSREHHVARLCALLLNTALACSKVVKSRVLLCATSFNSSETGYSKMYEKYFDNKWSMTYEGNDVDSEESRRVLMKEENGSAELEYLQLEDAALALTRFSRIEEYDFGLETKDEEKEM